MPNTPGTDEAVSGSSRNSEEDALGSHQAALQPLGVSMDSKALLSVEVSVPLPMSQS